MVNRALGKEPAQSALRAHLQRPKVWLCLAGITTHHFSSTNALDIYIENEVRMKNEPDGKQFAGRGEDSDVMSCQTKHGISEGGAQSYSEHSSASLQHHFLEPAELIVGLSSRKKHEEQ